MLCTSQLTGCCCRDMSLLDEDAQRFRSMLLWAAEQEEQQADSYGPDLLALRERLATAYRRLSEGELKNILRHRGKDNFALSSEAAFIYLAAPDGERTLPILNAKWNFGGDNVELRLRLGLFHIGLRPPNIASGFRFEMPEKKEDHRYCHAQPITELVLGTAMPWLRPDLPTEGPTFPLDAKGFTQLLLTVLVSLYGATILRKAAGAISGLVDSCQTMHIVGALEPPVG